MTDPLDQRARVHLCIKGRVQGVAFRFSTVDEARRLGVTGWVRNTYEGDVEVVAEGLRDRLQQLVSWCHAGPPAALVTGVEEQWLPYAGEFDAFRIRH
jgi:acylphosphatase